MDAVKDCKRVLLKISGEYLAGGQPFGFAEAALTGLAQAIKSLQSDGYQLAIVIGGGNFCRGESLQYLGIDAVKCDHVGMLGTMANAIVLGDFFSRLGITCQVRSALPVKGVMQDYEVSSCRQILDGGEVLILAGGTGHPLFTTDTAASLRAIELQADLLIKATNVEGVYVAAPEEGTPMYATLNYQEALSKQLQVMDLSAFAHCHTHKMLLRVMHVDRLQQLHQLLTGQVNFGTLVYFGESAYVE